MALREMVKKIRELNKFSPREELFLQIVIDHIFPKDEGYSVGMRSPQKWS